MTQTLETGQTITAHRQHGGNFHLVGTNDSARGPLGDDH